MVNSSIPILGTSHLIKVIRRYGADDGAGGIIPGAAYQVQLASHRARVSQMNDEDEMQVFGNATGERWKVVVENATGIARSDFLMLAPGSQAAPIDFGVEYRITYVKKQIDHGPYRPNYMYGDGHAGEKIAKILKEKEIKIQKRFYE